MTKFNPLNFIADHARMNLADAIKEAYEQGKRDAQPELIRCEDCKYNRECAIQFVAYADDKFFCGAGER